MEVSDATVRRMIRDALEGLVAGAVTANGPKPTPDSHSEATATMSGILAGWELGQLFQAAPAKNTSADVDRMVVASGGRRYGKTAAREAQHRAYEHDIGGDNPAMRAAMEHFGITLLSDHPALEPLITALLEAQAQVEETRGQAIAPPALTAPLTEPNVIYRLRRMDRTPPLVRTMGQEEADELLAFVEALVARQTWQPIATAPRDGTYMILGAPSHYVTTPMRAEIGHWDAEYRPRNPWQTHSNDGFTDGGSEPTHWMPLPPAPEDLR